MNSNMLILPLHCQVSLNGFIIHLCATRSALLVGEG